jgi:hypothetical protein
MEIRKQPWLARQYSACLSVTSNLVPKWRKGKSRATFPSTICVLEGDLPFSFLISPEHVQRPSFQDHTWRTICADRVF